MPSPQVNQITMNFFDALRAILNGQHVTRLEWDNHSIYCLLYDGRLTLHKDDGKKYSWIVYESDMRATDWVTTSIIASD